MLHVHAKQLVITSYFSFQLIFSQYFSHLLVACTCCEQDDSSDGRVLRTGRTSETYSEARKLSSTQRAGMTPSRGAGGARTPQNSGRLVLLRRFVERRALNNVRGI